MGKTDLMPPGSTQTSAKEIVVATVKFLESATLRAPPASCVAFCSESL